LEGRVQTAAAISFLLAKAITGADAVTIYDFAVNWCDNVALRDDDGLPGHARRLVCRRTCLHYLLQVWR